MNKIFILGLMLIFLNSCTQNTNTPENELYNITGHISNSLGKVVNATVVLDNSTNWTTTTSSDGYFEIRNVSKGTHTLVLKKTNADGSFSETENTVSVYSDLTLDSLRLPKPLVLQDPTDVTSSSMRLTWDKSDATDFYEYKLYRHDSPGIDETTGELIFDSISKLDTTFGDDNLYSNKNYYYRVFQMNDLGRIGGSNIVNAKTILANLIPDGGFEDPNTLENNWIVDISSSNDILTLTDSIKYVGNYSVYASYNGFGSYGFPIIQLKQALNVAPSTQYDLSVYVKIDGRRGNTDDMFVNIKQGNEYIQGIYVHPDINPTTGYVNMDWTKFYKRLTTINNDPLEIIIIFCNENIWIDELELKPAE
jgi:hypothetical protein